MKTIKLITLLLCILLPGITQHAFAVTETEPNNTWDNANVITLGATGTGNVTGGSDEDWWRVSIPGDGMLSVTWTSVNGNYIWCYVYDTLGTIQVVSANYTNGTFTHNIDGLAQGTYYIRLVAFFNTEVVTYSLSPTFTAAPVANDAEPNNTAAQAQTLALNGSTTGHNNYYFDNQRDTLDFYKITTNADGDLAVTVTSNNGQYIWFQILDGDGTTILSNNNTNGTLTQTVNGLLPGVYYVRLSSYYVNGFISYTISNTLTLPVTGNDIEPNGTPAQAQTLPLNSSVNGHNNYYYNGYRDTLDYFKITTNEDGDLRVTMTSNNGQYIWFQILDGNGTSAFITNNTNSTLALTVPGLAPGTYYVKVSAYYTSSGYIPYTLADSLFPPPTPIDLEPNATPAQADVMPLNGSITGHLNYYYNGERDTLDYFKVTTNVDGDLSVTLTSTNGQFIWFQILDGDGVTAFVTDNTNGTLTKTIGGLLPGVYYVRLYAYYISTGYPTYTLSNSLTPAALANDNEYNNSIATAQNFPPNSTLTGHVNYYYNGYRDSVDMFALTTAGDGSINLTLTSQNSQFVWVQLLDHDGITPVANAVNTNGSTNLFVNRLGQGTYYAKVYAYYTSTGYIPYTLTNVSDLMNWVHEDPANNDFASGGTLLPANTNKTGTLYYYYNLVNDNIDWWQIGYDGTGSMALHIDEEQNHVGTDYPYIDYALYLDTNASAISSGQLHAATNTINLTSLAIGKYYLRLTPAFSTFGAYQLNATYNERCLTNVAVGSSSQSTGCLGSITYNISNGLSPYTVQLYKNNVAFGAPQVVASTATFNNLGLGSYYAKAYSFGGSGVCNNQSTTTTFSPPPVPAITPNGLTTFCQGGSVMLTSDAAASYLWNTGATTQSISVNANGNFTVTVSNTFGCTNVSVPTSVTVNPLPAVPLITPNGPTTFCQGGSVMLTSDAASSYLWNTGATTQSISVNANGNFTVTVSNSNACTRTSATTTVTVNPLPAVPLITPDGPTTFCQGGSVMLTSDAASSYLWNTSATTQSISVNANGNFTVTVSNANGCTRTSGLTSVTVNPLPTVTLSPFSSVCNNAPAFALTGGSPAGGTYSGTGVSGGQFNPATAGVGTYTVTYTYTNGNGCSATATSSITVNDCVGCTPAITANGPTSFCQGGSVILTSSAGINYLWNTGATTQSITVSSGGNYSVTVTNGSNCTGTSAITVVTVNAPPAIPTITPGGSTTFCQGGSVMLTSDAASSYLWNTGATTQSISVNANGNFTVTVSNSNACTRTSAATTVTVNPLPAVPLITPDGPTTFCQGGSVMLTSDAASSYLWNTGATTQSISVNANGNFTVTVGNANGCTRTSATTTVTVNPLPTVTLAPFNAVCSSDQAFTLTGASPAGGTYSGTGVSSGQFNPATAGVGTYTISYSYTNANGCSSTATNSITVNNCGGCTPSISQNGSTTFCEGDSVTLTASQGSGYSWNTGATSQSITVHTSGTYTVTVTNESGCVGSASATVESTNIAPEQPGAISGIPGACKGQTGVVYSVTNVPGMTYIWSLPGGAIGSSTTNSITVSFSPLYAGGFICASATNSCGTSAPSCIPVPVITGRPAFPSTPSGPSISVCGPTTVTYSIPPAANATSYTWTVTGTGFTLASGQGTTSITVNVAAGFSSGQVRVHSQSCSGQSGENSMFVYGLITGTPQQAVFPFTGVCGGGTYNYAITPFSGATSIRWTAPAGSLINGISNPLTTAGNVFNVSITFPAGFVSGNVSVFGSNGCGNGPTRTVAVRSTPGQPAAISGQFLGICNQTGVVYSTTGVTGATSYSWSVPAGVNIMNTAPNQLSITVQYTGAFHGPGSICVTPNNACGAGPQRCLTVTCGGGSAKSVNGPSARNANEGMVTSEINAYPNPTSGKLNVSFNGNEREKYIFTISDLIGNVLISQPDIAEEGMNVQEIDLSSFAKGMYLLTINREGAGIQTTRIVIE